MVQAIGDGSIFTLSAHTQLIVHVHRNSSTLTNKHGNLVNGTVIGNRLLSFVLLSCPKAVPHTFRKINLSFFCAFGYHRSDQQISAEHVLILDVANHLIFRIVVNQVGHHRSACQTGILGLLPDIRQQVHTQICKQTVYRYYGVITVRNCHIPRTAVIVPVVPLNHVVLTAARLRMELHYRCKCTESSAPQIQFGCREVAGKATNIKTPERYTR